MLRALLVRGGSWLRLAPTLPPLADRTVIDRILRRRAVRVRSVAGHGRRRAGVAVTPVPQSTKTRREAGLFLLSCCTLSTSGGASGNRH
jgi:hypothetical protein